MKKKQIRLFYLIFPAIVYFFMSLNSVKISSVLGMNKSLEGKSFFVVLIYDLFPVWIQQK